jgi:hypothetical protein
LSQVTPVFLAAAHGRNSVVQVLDEQKEAGGRVAEVVSGQVVFRRAVVPQADVQILGEHIARVLAYAPEPLLAVDIAREL